MILTSKKSLHLKKITFFANVYHVLRVHNNFYIQIFLCKRDSHAFHEQRFNRRFKTVIERNAFAITVFQGRSHLFYVSKRYANKIPILHLLQNGRFKFHFETMSFFALYASKILTIRNEINDAQQLGKLILQIK